MVESHYKAGALNLAIQDGELAGQTVPHVHIHILPRQSGDFKNNDDVYEGMDKKEREYAQEQSKLNLDVERKARTAAAMAAEAA